MSIRNRKPLVLIAAMLFIGLLPGLWLGCASTATRQSTGEYVDDSAITTKVKTAFATDPTVSALTVHVKTYNGVVQLRGTVSTPVEKSKAEEIASGVSGVKSVMNDLTVKPK